MINTDKAASYGIAINELKQEGKCPEETEHRQVKYLNNMIESDPSKIKRLMMLILGFKSLKIAYATIKGFKAMRNPENEVIARDQFKRTAAIDGHPYQKNTLRLLNYSLNADDHAFAHKILGDLLYMAKDFKNAFNQYEISERIYEKIFVNKEIDDIRAHYLSFVQVGLKLKDDFIVKKILPKTLSCFWNRSSKYKTNY